MAAAAQSGTGSSLLLWTFLSELLLACRCCCCCLLLPLAEDLPPPPSQLPFTSFRLGRGLTAGSGLWCVAEGPTAGAASGPLQYSPHGRSIPWIAERSRKACLAAAVAGAVAGQGPASQPGRRRP